MNGKVEFGALRRRAILQKWRRMIEEENVLLLSLKLKSIKHRIISCQSNRKTECYVWINDFSATNIQDQMRLMNRITNRFMIVNNCPIGDK